MIPVHVKSMTNLSLIRCKMLKILSPVTNDKLIPILSSFLADRQKVLKKLAPLYTVGGKLSTKVRELGAEKKGLSEFFSLSASRVLRRI